MVISTVMLVGAGWLYQWGGLNYYLRAVKLMRQEVPGMREDLMIEARNEFYGTDLRGAERGILAGTWFGKVWVWNNGWLKFYTVDDNSIYSWFDGCSEGGKAALKKGVSIANVVEKQIFTDINKWRGLAKPGDYVTVYRATPENGGVLGNLREIYAYNFWFFLRRGIEVECAK